MSNTSDIIDSSELASCSVLVVVHNGLVESAWLIWTNFEGEKFKLRKFVGLELQWQ